MKGIYKEMMQRTCDCDNDGYVHSQFCTVLQLGLKLDESPAALLKIIEIGGKKIVMNRDRDGRTSLQYACMMENLSINIITKLIEVGG